MDSFPTVDPIPLPAPVWLFKLLHTVTLALHFGSVYFLIGGLACATWWLIRGRLSSNPILLNASGAVSHRLPVIMAFVVNLGIPPLLFTQVLYGRALYTSSVLIGAWWMGVIPMVVLAYYLLYRMATRFESGHPSIWMSLLALVLVLTVGHTYSENMTLMLRPMAWQAMYEQDPAGMTLPSGDPTTLLRWGFMMIGGLGMGGVGLAWLGVHSKIDGAAAALLRRAGGRCLALFTAAQLALGYAVYAAQPTGVQSALQANSLYVGAEAGWAVLSIVLVGLGVIAVVNCGVRSFVWPSLMAVAMLLNVLCIVIVRDGIRDVTLRLAGFEVWDRAVAANWSTIVIFLLLFVSAGATLAWLGYVVYGAKGETERYA